MRCTPRRRTRPWSSVLMVLLLPAAAAAQTGSIAGVVTDADTGQPVAGAQVTVGGTGLGVLTAGNGRYLITNVPAGTARVRVDRIGYSPGRREVAVAAGEVVVADFALSAKAIELTELVVVGYGERRRLEVTSAIASIGEQEIANIPVASLDAALQGRASGVQVVQNAGNPGNAITVRVRGSASISASNQPLYVVDGVPILSEDFSQLGMGGQDLSGVTGLNPDDIESIDILKDAAAAAIYGSRGSNGVVMINTKRGRAGDARLQFSAYTGWQEPERRLELLSASEYLEFMNASAELDGLGPNYYGVPGVSDRLDTDWQEAIFRPAPVSNYSVSLSGGGEGVRYRATGSLFDQEGVVIGSGYTRAAGRLNLDFTPSERLSLSASVALSREDNDRVQGDGSSYGVVTYALAETPLAPVRRNTGEFTGPSDGLVYYNAVALAELNPTEALTLRSLASLEAEYRLTDRLRLTGRGGYDVITVRELQWQSPRVEGTYPESAGGVSKSGYSAGHRYLGEAFLGWDAPVPGEHDLTVTGGGGVELEDWELNFIRGEGFSNESTHQVRNASIITDFDGTRGEHNLVSFFARGHYSLLGRYFLTGSIRGDGSSRFGPNARWGVFPSASAGWLMSAEPWFDLSALSTLRWRLSWGETGNEAIGDYRYLGLFGSANYGETPGIAPSSLPNHDLRWETAREVNGGLEAGVLEDRALVGFDLYRKTTMDLLLTRPITSTTGFTSVIANVGEMRNEGWELTLETINLESDALGGLRWTTEFNIARNRNTVTRLYGRVEGDSTVYEPFNTGERGVNRVEVGQPIGAFHMLRFEGVDPATGDAIYFDATGDGQITSADRVIVGNPHPDYFGGLTNRVRAGPLDAELFVSFSQGAEIFNAIRLFSDDGGYFLDNKFADVMDYWRQPGDRTDTPRPSYYGDSGASEISSRFIEDGSYVRIQDLTLGYTLPRSLGRRIGLESARVYVSANNLHTFTGYSGFSPDVNSNGASATASLGTDFYAYPLARSITIGLSGEL